MDFITLLYTLWGCAVIYVFITFVMLFLCHCGDIENRDELIENLDHVRTASLVVFFLALVATAGFMLIGLLIITTIFRR